MKKRGKATVKACSYAALFLGMQMLAGVGVYAYLCIRYLLQYPTLTQLPPMDALDLIMDMSRTELPVYVTYAIAAVNILSLLVVWLMMALRKKKLSAEIGLKKARPVHLALAAVIGMTFFCITILLDSLLPYSEQQWQELGEQSGMLMDDITTLSMLAVALIAPVVEEIFFRGLVYTRLRRGFGVTVSMVLSAVIFGLGHGGIIWFFSAGLAGLLLAFAFERTGSLYVPIVIHILNNTLAQILKSAAGLINGVILAGAVICLWAIYALWKGTKPVPEVQEN